MHFYRSAFLLLVAIVPLVGCDDNLGVGDWDATPDTAVIFSLTRTELIGFPSAYDFINHVPVEVETPGSSGRWDAALTEAGGVLSLVPAGVFGGGLSSRAAIATLTGETFDDVDKAPGNSDAYIEAPVPIRMGNVYIIRTRRESCGLGAGVHYGKFEPVEINAANGMLRFRLVVNPYCNVRDLVPPDED